MGRRRRRTEKPPAGGHGGRITTSPDREAPTRDNRRPPQGMMHTYGLTPVEAASRVRVGVGTPRPGSAAASPRGSASPDPVGRGSEMPGSEGVSDPQSISAVCVSNPKPAPKLFRMSPTAPVETTRFRRLGACHADSQVAPGPAHPHRPSRLAGRGRQGNTSAAPPTPSSCWTGGRGGSWRLPVTPRTHGRNPMRRHGATTWSCGGTPTNCGAPRTRRSNRPPIAPSSTGGRWCSCCATKTCPGRR